MSVPLAAVLVLSMALQAPAADRTLAEQLARSGQTAEALVLFERIVEENPADVEARLWIARLLLRMGRTAEAEAGFRSVLREHPSDVDARIGLGAALTRRDAWREAVAVLRSVETDAGDNAELFAALARAYRRAGDDRRALDYYKRAKVLAPSDPDLIEAYEGTLRAYGSSIEFEGLAESGVSDARSGALTGSLRVLPRLLIQGIVRVQDRDESSDAVGGGGAVWRLNRSTNVEFRIGGGIDNTALANGDVTGEVRHYRGAFEIGVNIRHLSFTGVSVTALSPILAWDTGERWRLAARYSYSRSSFSTTGETSRDHSVLFRETFRAWRRVDTTLTYAYGIESFEDLTADRLANLGANTVAATLRIRMPSLTSVAATWEHQSRSNDTRLDRLTVVLVQTLR